MRFIHEGMHYGRLLLENQQGPCAGVFCGRPFWLTGVVGPLGRSCLLKVLCESCADPPCTLVQLDLDLELEMCRTCSEHLQAQSRIMFATASVASHQANSVYATAQPPIPNWSPEVLA